MVRTDPVEPTSQFSSPYITFNLLARGSKTFPHSQGAKRKIGGRGAICNVGSERDVDLEGFHGEDPISLMRAIFPNLVDVKMIPKSGHMIALEAADELNTALLDYLARISAN